MWYYTPNEQASTLFINGVRCIFLWQINQPVWALLRVKIDGTSCTARRLPGVPHMPIKKVSDKAPFSVNANESNVLTVVKHCSLKKFKGDKEIMLLERKFR